jgi:hypothetical protein
VAPIWSPCRESHDGGQECHERGKLGGQPEEQWQSDGNKSAAVSQHRRRQDEHGQVIVPKNKGDNSSEPRTATMMPTSRSRRRMKRMAPIATSSRASSAQGRQRLSSPESVERRGEIAVALSRPSRLRKTAR